MLPKQPKELLSLSIAAALSLSGFALSTAPANADADAFTDALTGGKAKMDVRLRYEDVKDDTAGTKDADLLTIRTRLGYQTGSFSDFNAYVEMENTTALGDDNDANTGTGTNNWGNGNGTYATIADPEGTELNRYWLGYNGFANTVVRIGRQRIKLDNDRFIGNVGWRQNEQTYDSFTLTNNSLKCTKFFYAYLSEVNGIFGQNVDMDSHLINASYSGLGFGKITGYGYFLNFDATSGMRAQSQRTLGLRFKGAYDLSDKAELLFMAEYAKQDDYKDGADGSASFAHVMDGASSDIDYDYALLKLGVKTGGTRAVISYEQLEGDRNGAFQTPLATLHGQNGWADMFLTTPDYGLEDLSFSLSHKYANVLVKATYHDYEAESGGRSTGGNYGDEWNFVVKTKLGKHYSVLAKYASYSADDYKADMDKFWLQVGLKF